VVIPVFRETLAQRVKQLNPVQYRLASGGLQVGLAADVGGDDDGLGR